ncbi:MAG: hypothetical protein BRC31_00145 [Actinobacteria bacterium QS_5_72_10]|nr:MAG: hypothetical protein BRC31_00145 [Actinobacteria bacterium QS_5_72_10]
MTPQPARTHRPHRASTAPASAIGATMPSQAEKKLALPKVANTGGPPSIKRQSKGSMPTTCRAP